MFSFLVKKSERVGGSDDNDAVISWKEFHMEFLSPIPFMFISSSFSQANLPMPNIEWGTERKNFTEKVKNIQYTMHVDKPNYPTRRFTKLLYGMERVA